MHPFCVLINKLQPMIYFIRIIIIAFLPVASLWAQYATNQVKENFDFLSDYNKLYNWKYVYYDEINKELLSIDSTLNNRMGDRYSDVLEALLTMYEATGDKAYLVKFVAITYHIQVNLRQDNGVVPYPGWREFLNNPGEQIEDKIDYLQMYHDGRTIAVMARYAYMVSQNPALASTFLPPLLKLGTTFSSLIYPSGPSAIGNNAYTFGGYAAWLSLRSMQTLNYYIVFHWADHLRCFTPRPFPDNKERAQAVNQQVSFGVALTYLGLANNNNDYLTRAAWMGLRYFSHVTEPKKCKKILGKYVPNGNSLRYVLEHIPASNAYRWKSNGWRPQNCNELYGSEPDDYEDFAHAAYTLTLPQAFNNTNFSVNNQFIFDDSKMVRFRNTLSKYIYGGTMQNGCPIIHSGVDGDDFITYRTQFNGPNNPVILYDILSWAYLSKFDGMNTTQGSKNAYDIMFEVYKCGIENVPVPPEAFSGLAYNGLSMLVKEQWQKECVNLSLYKRNMVYNQDFFVKNKITVEPSNTNALYNSPESYAEPKISTKEFTIEPGVTVNMYAGEEIHLTDGFHAKAGSNFRASINPNACTDGMRVAGGNGNQQQVNIEEQIVNLVLSENELIQEKNTQIEIEEQNWLVYPNPANSTVNILGNTQENISIILSDISGRIILQHNFTESFYKLDVSALQQGLYILQLSTQTKTQTEKLLVR